MSDADFERLITYLRSVPGISHSIGNGRFENGNWWVKFGIDIAHPLAWNVVQELGCVMGHRIDRSGIHPRHLCEMARRAIAATCRRSVRLAGGEQPVT